MSGHNDLSGRRAIITGASQGLGLAIAEAFVAAGAGVMLCARSKVDLEAARKGLADRYPSARIEACVADVSKTADIDAVFEATQKAFGGLEILVNNAGVHGPIGPIETLDFDAWVAAIAVNLFGPVHASRRAIEVFKPAGHGKIINISGGGATSPQPGLTAYGASKAALVRVTETLAHELRGTGIDVNAVAPGALATRLTRELADAGPSKIGENYHSRVEAMLKGGGASPEKAAALCVYLGSRNSDGVSGRLISAAWDPWPFDATARADMDGSDIYALRRIVPADRGKTWGGA
jgi:NAD(P)-dependent dehydrogenase (short-subunit alcohol dehydrogenase family)